MMQNYDDVEFEEFGKNIFDMSTRFMTMGLRLKTINNTIRVYEVKEEIVVKEYIR